MISMFYSVEFLYIILSVFGYSVSSTKLKFLLATESDIIRCSEHEYLVIDNWYKLESSNISCPNQANLFEKLPIPVFNYSQFYLSCNNVDKNYRVMFEAWHSERVNGKLPKFNKNTLRLLSSIVNFDNHNYSQKADTIKQNESVALVNDFVLNWTNNNTYILYVTFDHQPTACHIKLALDIKDHNTRCNNEHVLRNIFCYTDPLLQSPMTNVNWTLVRNLLKYRLHASPDWRSKGGFYVDLRLVKSVSCFFSNYCPPRMSFYSWI